MRGVGYGLVCGLMIACRGEPSPPFDDAAPTDGRSSGDGGQPATPERPSPGGAGHGSEISPEAGAASSQPDDCHGEPVTLGEIHTGRVREGVAIGVGPLVASSQKFLISEAKSGSCLWGAFAADPKRSGAGSGLLLVSFGTKHEAGAPCRTGGDGLPDQLAPGDLLEARGFVDEFVPGACERVAPALQLRVDASCPVRRTGRAALPEPAVLDPPLANRLALGDDPSLLREWGAALVRLEAVSAVQDPDDGDAVFPFGVVRLAETRLEVSSRLYYFDLAGGGPRASAKAPRYEYPQQFSTVTGLVMLDYCSWILAPRDRCADVASVAGCTSQAAGP